MLFRSPRSIDLKKIEVETLKTSLEQSNQSLTELVADRTLFAIKAPADGTFYLGFIEQGKWVTGELVKSLVPLAAAPTGRTIATFIPATTTLVIQAFLDQANALSLALAPGATGSATLNGRAELPLSVTLKSIATTPDPEKTFPATFITKWPDGLIPAAGHALQVNVVSYSAESAIAVPNTALSFGPKGWVAEVKLADGKTEKRPVSLGRTSGDKTEIIGGLEAGQVIITP